MNITCKWCGRTTDARANGDSTCKRCISMRDHMLDCIRHGDHLLKYVLRRYSHESQYAGNDPLQVVSSADSDQSGEIQFPVYVRQGSATATIYKRKTDSDRKAEFQVAYFLGNHLKWKTAHTFNEANELAAAGLRAMLTEQRLPQTAVASPSRAKGGFLSKIVAWIGGAR